MAGKKTMSKSKKKTKIGEPFMKKANEIVKGLDKEGFSPADIMLIAKCLMHIAEGYCMHMEGKEHDRRKALDEIGDMFV